VPRLGNLLRSKKTRRSCANHEYGFHVTLLQG
jgi:hypothetical protein